MTNIWALVKRFAHGSPSSSTTSSSCRRCCIDRRHVMSDQALLSKVARRGYVTSSTSGPMPPAFGRPSMQRFLHLLSTDFRLSRFPHRPPGLAAPRSGHGTRVAMLKPWTFTRSRPTVGDSGPSAAAINLNEPRHEKAHRRGPHRT